MKIKIKQFVAMHSIAIIALFAIIAFAFTALSLTGCDTSNGNDTTHTHQWGAWKSNAAQHWKECSCGEEYGRANHNGNPCPVCDYNDSSHTHSYNDTWSKDATQHWKECSCGDKTQIANHSGNPCVCGYESGHSHSYSDTWSKDATQHWKECSCGDKKDVANHSGNPCICGFTSGDEIVEPTTAGLYRETGSGYIKIDTVTPTNISAVFTYVNNNAAAGAYLLIIGEDIITTGGCYLNRTDAKLTITGTGSMRTISLNTTATGCIFAIGRDTSTGISLTIGSNITLKGHDNNEDSVVKVYTGAVFTMQDNAKITGNSNSNSLYGGGGVFISHEGTFIMKDNSVISNNKAVSGGGVLIYGSVYVGGGVSTSGGTFIMNDNASISGNEASNRGGGVYSLSGGIFTMNDNASISGNEANNWGGGVDIYGGTFNMNGGTISGNKCIEGIGGGVNLSGVSVGATFRISNGIVYGNAAGNNSNTSGDSGAALYVTFSSTHSINAQYGSGETWTNIPLPFTSSNIYGYRNTTINVINGILQ